MIDDRKFAKGVWFNEKHQNAPSFVVGSLDIKKTEFVNWLREFSGNEDKVRFDIKIGKNGKAYLELNTYRKEQQQGQNNQQQQGYYPPQQNNTAMNYINQQEQALKQQQGQLPNFNVNQTNNNPAPWEKDLPF